MTQRPGDDICNVEAVEKWFAKDYERAKVVFDFKEEGYLETDEFCQLGVFSGEQFSAKCLLPGLTGFLTAVDQTDIIEGITDIPMISSSRLGKIWRMLDPIAFVNPSRSPNAEYVRNGSIIECQAKRDIKPGEEISVFYDKHFFGYFISIASVYAYGKQNMGTLSASDYKFEARNVNERHYRSKQFPSLVIVRQSTRSFMSFGKSSQNETRDIV